MSDNYDEDFENYEDEFEEDDAEEEYDVLPKSKGAPAPAQQQVPPAAARGPVRTSFAGERPASGHYGNSPQQRPPSRGPDYSNPLAGLTDAQRRGAVKKLLAAKAKLKHIQLSEVVMDDLFVSAPLSQAELAAMGRSIYAGMKVQSSQTHDDDKEEECQTEEVPVRPYACQVPDDRNAAEAAAAQGPGQTKAVLRVTQTDPEQELKMVSFMRWAGPVMLAALGSNPSMRKLAIPADKPPSGATGGLSAGSARLAHEALLAARCVAASAYAPLPEPLLLAAYGAANAGLGADALLRDHTIASKGVMCVWDLSSPKAPSAVMVSEGSPACCAWAPANRLVFAGMEEGGVCAWDLDEPDSRHVVESVAGQAVVCRRPAYSTEYLADVATSAAPIVALATLAKTESRSRPCQLVSLSAWGQVTVYTVSLNPEGDRSGGDGDFGLRPGSRVRLVKTAAGVRLGMEVLKPLPSLKQTSSAPTLDQMVATAGLQLLPGTHQFVVGADGGRVLRGSWVGVPPAPKEYVPADRQTLVASRGGPAAVRTASSVTSLHVSPFCPSAFLAGHDSGAVALHSVDAAAASAVWPDAAAGPVVVVRWSPSRPCVFFVLDRLCTLYCWDLSKSRAAPVSSQAVLVQEPGKQVASIPTFFDCGLAKTGDADGGRASYCIGYDDGNVDVHMFAPALCTPVAGELGVLLDVLGAAALQGKASAGGAPASKAGRPKPRQ